jgi:hypothetical protein
MQKNFIIKKEYFPDLENQKYTTKKRSANAMDSDDEESLDERPTTSKSKSAKRKKRSAC